MESFKKNVKEKGDDELNEQKSLKAEIFSKVLEAKLIKDSIPLVNPSYINEIIFEGKRILDIAFFALKYHNETNKKKEYTKCSRKYRIFKKCRSKSFSNGRIFI